METSMTRLLKLFCVTLICLFVTALAGAQSIATADLRGTVKDPSGAAVPNATVTIRDDAKGFSRTTTSNDRGEYLFSLVPPGKYDFTAEAGGFGKFEARQIQLTVGQQAEFPVSLKVASQTADITVNTTPDLIETQRTAVANTIDQQRIENLPINQRDYINFAQTSSQVNRDNGRPIGPAPTSGLNIGGQRGRSTLVMVDGADNTDNSVNAARSTLGQEAVQEFQVVTNSYAAEYGRASGGVVNVVSKSGSNNYHGNLFGFLRHRSFQANNRFAPIDDAPYTRTQYGATLGGPIIHDRTFFFGAFEQRRRHESGFFTTDVTQGLNASVVFPAIPGLNPIARTFSNLTAQQATFINTALASGVPANICAARAYAFFASTGGNIGLNGTTAQLSPNDGSLCPAISPILPGAIGPRFLLSGAPVPSATVNADGLPIAFRPLTQLQKVFPVSEGTTFTSLRLDHRINNAHSLSVRGGFNPSLITGIQVESQNQALGQNDFSRTGVQQLRDSAIAVQLNSALSGTLVNEGNFNWGRRSAAFRSANGDAVAFNISGSAFIGRELFSPVRRVENRYQIRDSVSWNRGHHLFKFGGDYNWINVDADFQLNFAGLFNFGGLTASTLNPVAFATAPAFTPVQQYGLGFPSNYIQGFGNPHSALGNKPMSAFVQDSWQVRPNLTLNLGVRYDYEAAEQIKPVPFTDPLTGIVLSADDISAAQNAINGQQGFPRDKNNFAPRVAFSWDPWNNNKTVVRGAYGIFYDHPLLAIGFNSDIADAAQQQQLVAVSGSPAQTSLLNATQIFQGTVCVPGATPTPICPAGVSTPGVAPTAQYQFGRQRFNDQTFPGFGTILPFTLPVAKDFRYAYAHQASFGVEHALTENLSININGLWVGSRHLPRPIDVNAPDNSLLIQNFKNFTGGVAPVNSTQALAFSIPLALPGCATPTQTNCARIPGMVMQGPTGAVVVNPFVANVFRPNGPNYFLAKALSGGLVSKAVLDAALQGSVRTPGVISPFGSVNEQMSNGTSNYDALNVDVKKRFSHNFQALLSYTWSHSIDDSSDLQTLLLPQDNRNVKAERGLSLFDQRHRFVLSGVITSPTSWRNGGAVARAFSDMTVAPIVEMSSGRPFNILSNVDTNNDQSNQTDRPNVAADGTLTLPPAFDATCQCFPTGTLGRNRGITGFYSTVDMRIGKAFRIGERMRFDVLAEGFNLLNKFNEASASPFFTDVNAWGKRSGNSYRSRPTAAFDPRQFQFGLKLNW
jgi:hypothetical protein